MIAIYWFSIVMLRFILIMGYAPKLSFPFSHDASFHYILYRSIRRHFWSRKIDEFVYDPGDVGYPLNFHRFASIFPEKVIRRFPWIVNLIIYALGIICILFLLERAIHHHLFMSVSSSELTLYFVIFFCTSMSNTSFFGNRILYLSFSERLLARFSVGIYVFSLTIFIYSHLSEFALYAFLAGLVAIFTSKFSIQSTLFFSIMMSLFFQSFLPIGLFVAIAICGIVLFFKDLTCQVREIWESLNAYFKYMISNSYHKKLLPKIVSIKEIKEALYSPLSIAKVLLKNEPTLTLLFFPELLLIGIMFALNPSILDHDIVVVLFKVVIASLCISVLIMTPKLSFLGEAYRYTEYNLVFIFPLLLSFILIQYPGEFLIPLISLYSFYVLIMLIFGMWFSRKVLHNYLYDVYLSGCISKTDVVLGICTKAARDICAVSGCKILWPGQNFKTQTFKELFEFYPFPKKDIQPLVNQYSVTKILVDKHALKRSCILYDFSSYQCIFENSAYQVFIP